MIVNIILLSKYIILFFFCQGEYWKIKLQDGEFTYMDNSEIKKIQEAILSALPVWYCNIERPIKQVLDEKVSLEMYYCIKVPQYTGSLTMTELARYIKVPKQQMTKLVNRLVEQDFAKRIYDPSDRRIIKIELTDSALQYIDRFLAQDMECYQKLVEQMNETDRNDFFNAMTTLSRILHNIHNK